MRVQFYAANLHHGGAVLVAATFFDQLVELRDSEVGSWMTTLNIAVSSRVLSEMAHLNALSKLRGVDVSVRDDPPRFRLRNRQPLHFDLRYSIMAPEYRGRSAHLEIAGFADGSILPARPDIQLGLGGGSRAAHALSYPLRSYKLNVLRTYDAFIVQTHDMATALKGHVGQKRVEVVPNSLSRPFVVPTDRTDHNLPPRSEGEVRLFYPARGYPHKNHRFIPDVAHAFTQEFHRPMSVVVTLRDSEFRKIFGAGMDSIINIGEVRSRALPSLYSQTDALFFPSLNETFSATPLEAAFMMRPIVAADLPFMRSAMGDIARYYKPGDPADAARTIRRATAASPKETDGEDLLLVRAQQWARTMAAPLDQARQFLTILKQLGEHPSQTKRGTSSRGSKDETQSDGFG